MNVDNLQQFGEQDALSMFDGSLTTTCGLIPSPDPLQDDLLGETDEVGSQKEHIHIRIQQRNGRKTLTTLQGLGKGSSFTSPKFSRC